MEVSRFCHTPVNLGDFVALCKLLESTDKLAWITEHLNECKLVQKVSFDDFARLVLDLTRIGWANTLNVHKHKIICQPITKWLKVIEDLVSKSSALATD